MGRSDVIGYNRLEVEELRGVINNTAQSAGSEIPEELKKGIVMPMSKAWYAPEAVSFFETFAEVVSSAGTAITEAFDSFRDAVQKAGANWAENTGGEAPVLAAIEPVTLTLDVSAIQANNSGNITIDKLEAEEVANELAEVENEIKTKLEKLAEKLNAETAFIGGSQAEALENCFVTVSGAIHSIFKFLTEGDNSLKQAITATVQKYGDVSEGISNAFNNSTSN